MRNWLLKALSVLTALALWAYAKLQKTYEVEIPVRVKVFNKPDGLDFSEPPDSVITARLLVSGSQLVVMAFSDFWVNLDLSRVRLGRNAVELSARSLVFTRPVRPQVLGFVPSKIEFVIERVRKKKLAVIPKIKGAPAPGFTLVSAKALGSVIAEAPASLLKDLSAVTTWPINIEGRRESFNVIAKVSAPPGVKVMPQDVEVKIVIEPVVKRELWVRVSAKGRVKPESLRVVIEGPRSAVERAVVSAEAPGKGKVAPVVKAPSSVRVVSVEPQEVEVR